MHDSALSFEHNALQTEESRSAGSGRSLKPDCELHGDVKRYSPEGKSSMGVKAFCLQKVGFVKLRWLPRWMRLQLETIYPGKKACLKTFQPDSTMYYCIMQESNTVCRLFVLNTWVAGLAFRQFETPDPPCPCQLSPFHAEL